MHTPGPWEFEYDGGPSGPLVFHVDPRDETNGVGICEVSYANNRVKESLANARMICAAPDLLDCLLHLADEIDPERMVEQGGGDLAFYLKQARALIKTVKGEK